MRYLLQIINKRGETIILDKFKDMREGYKVLKNLKEEQKTNSDLKEFNIRLFDSLIQEEIN